ncbi:MAG: hypothetical protein WAM73_15060 [Desulfobacterales bacterium]
MAISDDFSDPLVEEILTDVAGSFFEKRRQLDDKIDLFHSYVKDLQLKETSVRSAAAFLNHLLLKGRQAPAFYKMLGVADAFFTAAGTRSTPAALAYMPFAIGARARFVKLVANAYAALQKSCTAYLHGRSSPEPAAEPKPADVYYDLVLEMHRLVNSEINRINVSISPSCTLQFAKRLNPQMTQKEKITGGGIADVGSLDEKLCYSAIELDSLSLEKYPELPEAGTVKPALERFCKNLYGMHAEETKAIVADLKARLTRC